MRWIKQYINKVTHKVQLSNNPDWLNHFLFWIRQSMILQSQNKSLRIALLASLIIHLLTLLIHIVSPYSSALKQSDIPLEVELVNAYSPHPPHQATILAQANLNGGGDHSKGRATTPLPATFDNHAGELIKRLQKRAAELQQEQQRLLTQNAPSYSPNSNPLEKLQPQINPSNGKDRDQTDLIRQRLEAEIARDQQLIAKRPRRAQITASSAMAVDFAQYYDSVRRKIERYGTTNFPHADGKPLYGSLVLVLNVRQDGHLGYIRNGYHITDIILQRSSGNQILDREAIAIARATAPFGTFTPEMQAHYDILEIIYTFHFTKDGLQTQAQISTL